ncbi:hypothetical protein Holit_00671 [Hollandina sp. SP2]
MGYVPALSGQGLSLLGAHSELLYVHDKGRSKNMMPKRGTGHRVYNPVQLQQKVNNRRCRKPLLRRSFRQEENHTGTPLLFHYEVFRGRTCLGTDTIERSLQKGPYTLSEKELKNLLPEEQ